MFKKALTIGIILPIIVLILKLVVIGISNIKLSEFKPVVTIFLMDTSASNRESLDKQQQCILKIAKILDSEDQAKIYVVTEDAYEVYNGGAHKFAAMRKAMKKRSEFDSKAYGTAYGVALKKAVGDALIYKELGYTPAIVFLGDMENEGAINKQINWNTLPANLKKTLKYAPDLSLSFFYAHPQKLDGIRQNLITVLDEKRLIIASEENVDNAIKKFATSVGR